MGVKARLKFKYGLQVLCKLEIGVLDPIDIVQVLPMLVVLNGPRAHDLRVEGNHDLICKLAVIERIEVNTFYAYYKYIHY